MKKKSTVLWRVYLYSTLPCSAFLDVMAESEEDAKEQAEAKSDHAKWGVDQNKPDGCRVEVGTAERL